MADFQAFVRHATRWAIDFRSVIKRFRGEDAVREESTVEGSKVRKLATNPPAFHVAMASQAKLLFRLYSRPIYQKFVRGPSLQARRKVPFFPFFLSLFSLFFFLIDSVVVGCGFRSIIPPTSFSFRFSRWKSRPAGKRTLCFRRMHLSLNEI